MPIDTKFKDYSVKDFLADEQFLLWQLLSDESSDDFWKQVQQQYPHQKKNIDEAIRVLHSITINRTSLSSQKENEILDNVYARYRRHKTRRFIYWSSGVAASIASLFFFLSPLTDITEKMVDMNAIQTNVPDVRLDTIQNVQLIIGKQKPIVMAEDADVSWSKKDEIEINGRSSNSTYKSRIAADVEYTTLLVPYGKRSFLTLCDGTKVWINSGTELRFPVNINTGEKERSIYVNGEIYIEVAQDKDSPFYVHTSDFKVKVYGTKFNVMSYKEDRQKSVVLVDGSVSVLAKEESGEIFLRPNQMYNKDEAGSQISNVYARQYITWKDGIWEFTSEQLGSIALRLSRYYGVEIHCDSASTMKTCTGKLVLFDDVNETLQVIKDIFGVQYTSNQSEITISANP